jgi:hypothetical protein
VSICVRIWMVNGGSLPETAFNPLLPTIWVAAPLDVVEQLTAITQSSRRLLFQSRWDGHREPSLQHPFGDAESDGDLSVDCQPAEFDLNAITRFQRLMPASITARRRANGSAGAA